jgi:uncharacterized protein
MMLVVLAMLCGIPAATAQTFPPLTGRVVDDAHLLSAEQVAQLTQLSDGIEKASSRQFVVATVPDLQGYPIEDYGYRLGRAWKIGQGESNNGIILLVAPKERKIRIEVGYGLEPIMTDALSSTIINTVIRPKFKAGDLPGGIIDGANAIAEQMKLPLEAAEVRGAKVVTAKPRQSAGSDIPFGVIFFVIVVLFIVLSWFRRGTNGKRYRSGHAPVILWGPGLGGGSGSGWGGGSSWGSSGGSDWGGGGGGGGFSGGGGSFGGGGASGDW